jgi:hypothetical protein
VSANPRPIEALRESAEDASAQRINSIWLKFGRKFGYLFVLFAFGPQLIGIFPGAVWFGNWYYDQLPRLSNWIGRHVLGIKMPPIVNHGSGDQVSIGYALPSFWSVRSPSPRFGRAFHGLRAKTAWSRKWHTLCHVTAWHGY